MKKNRGIKYTLIKTAAAFTAITLISSGVANTIAKRNEPAAIEYTREDLNSNLLFYNDLVEIMNTQEITFNNQELQTIIEKEVNGPITKESLSKIESLGIYLPLDNTDLSDLKYLTNLQVLYISNNTINLSDTKYNQNLYALTLSNCKYENTQDIPNSTELIEIKDSICLDNEFIAPYYAKEITSLRSITNNIRLKNPSYLEKLYITSDTSLDMTNLKNCTNLKELTLLLVSNIKNPQVLSKLPSLEKITLDEYAAIWLDLEVLENLPLDYRTKKELEIIIRNINIIENSLNVSKDAPDYIKAQNISTYIIDNYEYDSESVENFAAGTGDVSEYNRYPFTTMLETKKGVCVNYACLFQALSNRLELESFQLFGNQHTWNTARINGEYRGFDISGLDTLTIMEKNERGNYVESEKTSADIIRDGLGYQVKYFNYDMQTILDETHIADYLPLEEQTKLLNIGYINANSIMRQLEKEQLELERQFVFYRTFLIFTFMLLAIQFVSDYNYRKKQRLMYEEEYEYYEDEYYEEETRVLKK